LHPHAGLFGGLPGIATIFTWDAGAQAWLGFFPGQPAFLSAFNSLNRLDVVFIRNALAEAVPLALPELGSEFEVAGLSSS